MIKPEQQKRFDALLALLLEGAHASEDVAEIIELAEEHSELKQALRLQLEMDFLLTQVEDAEQNQEAFLTQVLKATEQEIRQSEFEEKILGAIPDVKKTHNTVPIVPASTPHRSGFFSPVSMYLSWSVSGISLAACAFFALFFFHQIWFAQSTSGSRHIAADELQTSGVAVVMNVVGNNRGDGDGYKIGESISPGMLTLSQGFMALEFYHGAQLKIAGPAKLDIIDEQRVMLYQGKVMTDVPEVAIGFTIDTPNSEVIDLGTAIGVSVEDNGQAHIHVFDGLIETVDKNGEKVRIAKGGAIHQETNSVASWELQEASASLFSEFSVMADLDHDATDQQQRKWLSTRAWVLTQPDLVAYYDFEKDPNKPRLLNNIAPSEFASNGAIVGAKWAKGPWFGKSSLEFKKASDRVRVNIDGKWDQFTLATWIKIDSLDRKFNSILLTDGYHKNDIHWQFGGYRKDNTGALILGLKHSKKAGVNYRYSPFFSVSESGSWYHLATTVNQNTQEVKTYINGKLVEESPLKRMSEHWQIGEASIGNWASENKNSPVRNLNGAMAELMIFSRALTQEQIVKIALK